MHRPYDQGKPKTSSTHHTHTQTTIILKQKEKSRDKAMHPMNFFYSDPDIQYFGKWVVHES